MKSFVFVAAFALANPVSAQTMSASSGGGAYDGYVAKVLHCMSGVPGDATAQDACIVAGVEDCQAHSGVFESCLAALRDGFDATIQRVEAEELKVCEGKLDSACAVVLRGHALIRSGTGLNAEQWTDVLTQGQ